jgi:hypothetical protein
VLAACLMVAAASNTQAHQEGTIGSNDSELTGPFSFLVSLYRAWAAPPVS